MLKKILLILLALILTAGSAAAGDCHLDIQFAVHNGTEESAVTAEAIFREKEILILSGLFPSYAFSVGSGDAELSGISGLEGPFEPFRMPPVKEILEMFTAAMNPETMNGVFSGDLFEEARTVTTCTFTLDELFNAFRETNDPEKAGTAEIRDNAAGDILHMENLQELSKIVIRCSLYDGGNYVTMNGVEGDRTLFTASCDFTDPLAVKTVFGYPDSGKNYYDFSEIKVLSEREIIIHSTMISDAQKLGYRAVMNNPPVLRENWNIKLSENRKEICFTGEIIPGNEKKTVEIGGTISTENKTLLMAKISFKNWEKSWFTLAVSLDDTPVNTESLKVITPDSADAMPFLGEVSMNAMTFLTKLNQALPEDYQLELFPMN